jgi:pimeloyl-ACP methyl ester carboxylesterase
MTRPNAALLLLIGGCVPDAEPSIAPLPEPTTGTTATWETPAWCGPAEPGWHDITGTPASPYFVHDPATDAIAPPLVVFLPGGSATALEAELTFEAFLGDAPDLEKVRVVVPYTQGVPVADRAAAIAEEVRTCTGTDPAHVHLAGHSMGGIAAFDVLVADPQPWASLLGAPAAMDPWDQDALVDALGDRPVLLGVGELDPWKPGVVAQHTALVAAGVDAEYVEFVGIGHVPPPGWSDQDVLFEWWLSR